MYLSLIASKHPIFQLEEGQNDIFYITGESVAGASSSPFLETLRKKGIEVLYMVDPIDEYATQQLKEFDGKKLKRVHASTAKGCTQAPSLKDVQTDQANLNGFQHLSNDTLSETKWIEELFDKIMIEGRDMIWQEVQYFHPGQLHGKKWESFLAQKILILDFVFQNCLKEVAERLFKQNDFGFECKSQIHEGFLQVIDQIVWQVQIRYMMLQQGLQYAVDTELVHEDFEKKDTTAGCDIGKDDIPPCGRRCGRAKPQRRRKSKAEKLGTEGAPGSTEDVPQDTGSVEQAIAGNLKKGIAKSPVLRGGANRFQALSEEEDLSEIPEETEPSEADTSGNPEGEISTESGKRSFYKDFFQRKAELRGGAGGSSTTQNKKLTEAVDGLKNVVKAFAEDDQQGSVIATVISDGMLYKSSFVSFMHG